MLVVLVMVPGLVVVAKVLGGSDGVVQVIVVAWRWW